ncbi:hypothetical protein NG895_13290 [Aeoliella sp. ICT_H6.2]|uniref:Periplasmic folding chaperone n=1 Tax=Aeoliella straminimaris TaxID=2954799 RepID=A0A9X2FHG7_9BACT|nr:hypothetical protein [Aeoliella straminimaris]MCO6044881.1 hypothetical protein [Aeoliella straminimaris]
MFRFFRRYQKTFIVVGGVILMLAFTVADPLTQWMRSREENAATGRSPKATAVTWDGGKLTEGELDRLIYHRQLVNSFVRRVAQYGQMMAQTSDMPYRQARVTPIGLIGENWDTETLEEVVVRTHILADRARDMGIVISDNAVLDYINELGMGQLGSNEMYEVLAMMNQAGPPIPEELIYSSLREELLAEAALRSYGAGHTGHSMFAAEMPVNRWEEWKQTNDRAKVEAAAIDPESVMLDVPQPTDKELRDYYNEYKEYYSLPRRVMNVELPSPTPGFMIPPKVSLQYLRANYDEFIEKYEQQVTDEEVAEYYEANKDLLFVEASFEDVMDEQTTPDDQPGDESAEASEEPAAETEEATTEEMSEEPAAEQPATEETPAEEPSTEETPSEETPTEEPSTEEPATAENTEPAEEPAAETPATEEPAADQPAEETPAEGDAPADEQSATRPASPFRLASYQPEASESDTSEPAGEDAPAADSEPAASDSEEDSDETAASEPAEEMTDEVEETEEVTYQPLEEVADKIRQTLAEQKFFEEIDATMQQVVTRLIPAYSKYLSAKLDAEAAGKEAPEPPAELRNLAPIAEELNLEFEKTGYLDIYQLYDTEVGKTVNQQEQPVANLMFREDADLYEPILTSVVGRFGDRYLVMKTGEEESRQPKFEEIKDEVAAAWKREKAAEIALERAKETAKEAQESGLTLAEFFVDQPDVKVTTTPTFTQLTLGDIAPTTMMPTYRLSQPEGLEDVGPTFLDDVFKLKEGEVAAQPNFDKSIIYVVRLADQVESEDQLRTNFLADANFWPGRRYFLSGNAQQSRQEAINAVLDNLDLKWKRSDAEETEEEAAEDEEEAKAEEKKESGGKKKD